MKNKKVALAVFLIPLALIIFLNKKEVTLTTQKDMKLERIGISGYQLSTILVLNNPNLLSVTIKSIREKFYLNGSLVGIVDNEINQGIGGRKDSEFPLNIRFPSEVLKTVPKSINDSTVTMRTEGEVSYQNLVSKGQVKINSSTVLVLPK